MSDPLGSFANLVGERPSYVTHLECAMTGER